MIERHVLLQNGQMVTKEPIGSMEKLSTEDQKYDQTSVGIVPIN